MAGVDVIWGGANTCVVFPLALATTIFGRALGNPVHVDLDSYSIVSGL